MPPPIIAEGTGYVLFAYDVAHAFDLAAAETRLASATQRQTVKQKRRAPAFFEYDPAPLRVTEPADSLAVGEHVTAPYVEFVLYDFGAVSVSYAIPLQGPLTGLPALSTMLYGNEQLQADSRRRVQQLIEALGDAAIRSRLADFVEDYVVFQIEAFTEPLEASMLWTEHAQTVAQVLRAESRPLSQQEVSDALASRLSFGPNDATLIDTDVTLLFDPEGEDVRAVIEFANTQLLEMRYLDAQLDEALERAYDLLGRSPGLRRFLPSPYGVPLQRLGRLAARQNQGPHDRGWVSAGGQPLLRQRLHSDDGARRGIALREEVGRRFPNGVEVLGGIIHHVDRELGDVGGRRAADP